MDVKIKPPMQVEGRLVLRGPLGSIEAEKLIVNSIDSEGYLCLSLYQIPERSEPSIPLGTIRAKKLIYQAFRLGNDFQVIIQSVTNNHILRRTVKQNLLVLVFQKIPEEGMGFSKIRSEVKQTVVDALHLTSALVILQLTGHIDCIRESNRSYYRRLKPWSLDICK